MLMIGSWSVAMVLSFDLSPCPLQVRSELFSKVLTCSARHLSLTPRTFSGCGLLLVIARSADHSDFKCISTYQLS